MLTLVCPVYNEAANIRGVLEAVEANIAAPKRMVIVYDREEDTTLPVVREVADRFSYPIELVRNAAPQGGALNAILTGFRATDSPAVLVTMADLSDRLSDVDTMYDLIVNHGYDLVSASRYMRGGTQRGGPWLKSRLSRLAGISLRRLTGLPTHDPTNNFKMYSRRLLSNVTVESTAGFELALELAVKAHKQGYRIAEVPTVWTDRAAGRSRFKLMKWIPHYLRWYFYAFGRGVNH